MRCNEKGAISSDGKYYHQIGIDDEGKLHGVSFQISVILALIISACEREEFGRTHLIRESLAVKYFLQLERSGLSVERFRFGEGRSKLVANLK